MNLKREKKEKKKINFYWFNKFLYFYFFTSIIVASIFMIAVFQSQIFKIKEILYWTIFQKPADMNIYICPR